MTAPLLMRLTGPAYQVDNTRSRIPDCLRNVPACFTFHCVLSPPPAEGVGLGVTEEINGWF
jgi:hypothetical protein